MGQAKSHRQRFLAEHPKCCFCGGVAASETIDHIPPRVLFTKRNWPETFEFPACAACNRRTSGLEQVVALYAHLTLEAPTPEDDAAFKRLLSGVYNNARELLPTADTTANEKKKFLKKTGLGLPIGSTTKELHLVKLPANFSDAIAPFFAKLFCALYYREMKTIFPAEGAVSVVFTTPEYTQAENLQKILGIITGYRSTARGKVNIADEFAYRYESGEDGRVFAALVHLRARLVVLVGGVTDRSNFEVDDSGGKWRDIFGQPLKAGLAAEAQ